MYPNTAKEKWFSEEQYAEILDNLVIVCVDTLVKDRSGKILLGKRQKFPIKDWWIFGGRMFAHENYSAASKRGLTRELGFIPHNEPSMIGYYDLVWEIREEPPQKNGCHVVLAAMEYILSPEDQLSINVNNEHSYLGWFSRGELESMSLHPTLVKIINDSWALHLTQEEVFPHSPKPSRYRLPFKKSLA